MVRLLRLNLYRLTKSRAFIVLMILLVGLMILTNIFRLTLGWKTEIDCDPDLAVTSTIYREKFDDIASSSGISSNVSTMDSLMIVAYVLIVPVSSIFTALFYTPLFKDRTISNILSSGQSKVSLYLTCLIGSAVASLAFLLMSVLTIVVMCIACRLHPIISIASLLIHLLMILFASISIDAIVLFILFVTGRTIITTLLSVVLTLTLLVTPYVLGLDIVFYAMSDIHDNLRKDNEKVEVFFDESSYKYIEYVDGEKVTGDVDAPLAIDRLEFMKMDEKQIRKTKIMITLTKLSPLPYTCDSMLLYQIDRELIPPTIIREILIALGWTVVVTALGARSFAKKDV